MIKSLLLVEKLLDKEFILQLIFPIFFLIIIWVFFIFPKKNMEKERKNVFDSLKAGNKILTAGGLIGKIKKVNENDILLKISKNTIIKVNKSFVKEIINLK
jgi:preprotein translocase subunit YajC